MKSQDTYLSIERESRSVFRDRASKFIGIAIPVNDESQVKAALEKVKKEFYDANHHCYAYRIGKEGSAYRANDDGEPAGSAGKPIYNQLLSKGLSDTLVVVVRYFGGTKLGVPGLINAYKTATLLALEEAGTTTRVVEMCFDIEFGYTHMNDVMKILKDMSATIVSQDFDQEFKIRFNIRESKADEVRQRLSRLINISTSIHIYQNHHV
jgi:uncharacterized YigZ family protein